MYKYDKLMSYEPTVYGELVNSLGQKITFVEHPVLGEDSAVIAVCHELELACDTTFFELDDMVAEHKEYEPSFRDGRLYIGEFIEE